ncbi:MAG: SurA N-terminal domain-containing protein [Alphaproteobacteria bacterium]|jgi:peptidyl-prolyl cis-trans isomerase D|nr:SurA N-terminal domain-containing protein [Alphaproteobacteria bacterium]
MLLSLRKKVAGVFVKGLFGVLVLSFAVWGVGDVVRGGFFGDTVAEVGGLKIEGQTLDQAFRRELNRLRPLNIDAAQARQMGVLDRVLQQLIAQAAYDAETGDLGMTVSDDAVRQDIRDNRAFKNQQGRFDRFQFEQVLRSNGFTEEGYVQQLRRDMARDQVLNNISEGAVAPKAMVNALYRWRAEKRVAETMDVKVDKAAAVGTPDESALVEFHKDNASRFTAPEYRSLRFIHLEADDLAGEIEIAEDAVRKVYDERIDEFTVRETRTVQQMVLADEAAAKKAMGLLSEGRSFAAVAKDVAGQEEDSTKLGAITENDLPEELAEKVFALAKNVNSAPVEGPFGWHIFRVVAIEAGRTQSYAEVKKTLREELAKEQAIEALFKVVADLEDTLGGGATLGEAANQLNLKLRKLAALDAEGKAKDGKAIADLPGQPFIQTVFDTESGSESALTETGDGGYFILKVDGLTPSVLRSLDSIRDEVAAAWRDSQRSKQAKARADTIVERINNGDQLAELSKKFNLTIMTSQPFTRDGTGVRTSLAPAAVVETFGLKKTGTAAVARTRGGFVVVRLKEIRHASSSADREAVEATDRAVRNSLADDLLLQFNRSLQDRHGVSIDSRVLQRLFSDAG